MKLHRQMKITSQRRVFTGSTTVHVLDHDNRRSPVFFSWNAGVQPFMLVFFRIFVFFLGMAAVFSQFIGASAEGHFESASHICRCKYLYLHIYFRFTFVWGFKNIVVTDVEDCWIHSWASAWCNFLLMNHHQLIIGSTTAAHLHSLFCGQII